MTRIAATLLSAVTVFAMGACKPKEAPAPAEEPPPPKPVAAPSGSPSQAFWGDTHLHTSYSPNAYLMQNRSADPDKGGHMRELGSPPNPSLYVIL